MKKIRFALLALAAVMIVSACNKEEDPIVPIVDDSVVEEPQINPALVPFVGTFDMIVEYDSVGVDGAWLENGFMGMYYDADTGYVVFSADTTQPDVLKIDGYEILHGENGEPVEYHFYDTKATLDADGKLVPEASQFEMNGYHFSMTYGALRLQDDGSVRFRIEQHVPMGQSDAGYILTAYCTKRAE
ncbi:MAG: hypothetical protein MJZ45_00265 [Bacteroidales bacterium]|nr:hypothetical protein [Bacteroidales bacterium]